MTDTPYFLAAQIPRVGDIYCKTLAIQFQLAGSEVNSHL